MEQGQQKKKALGRGLEQLFSSEILDFDSFESNVIEQATESDVKEIPVNEIRANPYQPRKNFDQAALDELAESIKNYGVFQPIIVKKSIKGYDLVAGERRLRASKLAGLETIPAIIKNFSDDMMREIALLENLQRENLTAIELAWAYKNIIDSSNIRQDDLAKRLGKSRSHVTNTLGLLRLPKDVQDMVLENKLSMAHARVLSKLEDNSEIKEMAKKVISDNISVHELENMTSGDKVSKKVPNKRKESSNNEYKYLENNLRDVLGTKVKIDNKKMEIYFDNVNDLNRILEIMNINMD